MSIQSTAGFFPRLKNSTILLGSALFLAAVPACSTEEAADDVADVLTIGEYDFDGTKDGMNLDIEGYVPTEADKRRVMSKINTLFPAADVDADITVAAGAPDANWTNVALLNIEALSYLEDGDFSTDEFVTMIEGDVKDDATLQGVRNILTQYPSPYRTGEANFGLIAPVNSAEQIALERCRDTLNRFDQDAMINFAFDQASVAAPSKQTLIEDLADAALDCKSFEITVQGYTDAIGSKAYNKNLGMERATAVMKALKENGLADSRITAKSFGENQPIATNETPSGRAENRRVEFTVTR